MYPLADLKAGHQEPGCLPFCCWRFLQDETCQTQGRLCQLYWLENHALPLKEGQLQQVTGHPGYLREKYDTCSDEDKYLWLSCNSNRVTDLNDVPCMNLLLVNALLDVHSSLF